MEEYEKPHDAGFDAFTTGYVFLRLCAILKSSFECSGDHPSWSEMQFFAKLFRNRINLMRASSHYLDLEVDNQKSVRPSWMVLKCRRRCDSLSHSKVCCLLLMTRKNANINFPYLLFASLFCGFMSKFMAINQGKGGIHFNHNALETLLMNAL